MERPGVVLEIGVGGFPIVINPTMLRSVDGKPSTRKFDQGSIYIGIDMPEDPNRDWYNFLFGEEPRESLSADDLGKCFDYFSNEQKSLKEERPSENVNLMIADAHTLPLRSNTVDEVFISNVFGSQLQSSSIEKIMTNVDRVLKTDGRIVIRETTTPHWSDVDELSVLLTEHGFKVTETAIYGSQRYSELMDIYGATHEDTEASIFQDEMYYCIAERSKTA